MAGRNQTVSGQTLRMDKVLVGPPDTAFGERRQRLSIIQGLDDIRLFL